MTTKIILTRQAIEARAGEQSFSRGEAYYKQGAISKITQQGETVEAICKGSSRSHYRVSATFKDGKLVKTTCNCDYDWGGDCKHSIALLLALLDKPDSVKELPSITKLLAKRSKDDLITLIGQMAERYPDLMPLIKLQGVDEVISGGVKLDLKAMRKQLKKIFAAYEVEDDDDDYYHDYDEDAPRKNAVEASLVPVTDLAVRFSKRGDWHNATTIYQTILETFVEWVNSEFFDVNGLTQDLQQVIGSLDDCLSKSAIKTDVKARQTALESLIGLLLWDIHYTEIDTNLEIVATITKHTLREDSAFVRQLIAAGSRKQKTQDNYVWQSEIIEDLLAHLDALDGISPEITLTRLREKALYGLLIEKLLALGRFDEASNLFQNHVTDMFEQTRSLTDFVDNGHVAYAEDMAESLEQTHPNPSLSAWLLRHYQKTDNKPKLLTQEWKIFELTPSEHGYHKLKTLAQAIGTWERVYEQIIKTVSTKPNNNLLMRIYLIERDWDAAWGMVASIPSRSKPSEAWGYRPRLPEFDLVVAEASYLFRPQRAIPVLRNYVYDYIEQRNRPAYVEAVRLISKLRDIYDQEDDIETWGKLIDDLRKTYKTLRALHDELNKAGF